MRIKLKFLISFLFLISSVYLPVAAENKLSRPILSEENKKNLQIPKQYSKNFESLPAQLKKNKYLISEVENILEIFISQGEFSGGVVFEDDENFYLSLEKQLKVISVVITGDSFISESDYRSIMTIQEGNLFRQELVKDTEERLLEFMQDRGLFKSEVSQTTTFNDQGAVINWFVREGAPSKVRNIVIDCQNTELRKRIEFVVQKYRREVFSQIRLLELLDEVKNYLSKNQFYRAKILDPEISITENSEQVDLKYIILEPTEYEIIFDGIKYFSRRNITEAIQLDKFFSSSVNIDYELQQRLTEFYYSEGFARVEIRSEQQQDTENQFKFKISFYITENPKIRIESIKFSGQKQFDGESMTQFINEHSGDKFEEEVYSKVEFERGLSNLTTHMRNQGYVNFKILSSKVEYNQKKDGVDISITVDEGDLIKISAIQFVGNDTVPAEEIYSKLLLKVDQSLRLSDLETDLKSIQSMYFEKGYLDFKFLTENPVQYKKDLPLADLRFEIAEGPKVIVKRILIEGNYITKNEVIIRELEFREGEVLTPEKLSESIARLQRLGHFTNIDISQLEIGTPISERTIIIKVTDRNPGVFSVGAGATNENSLTLRGYTGIGYRNIKGTGRGVSLRLEGSYNVTELKYLENKVTVGYVEPALFRTRTRGRATYVGSQSITDFRSKQVTELNQTTFSLEEDITSHFLVIYDLWSSATVRDFYILENSDRAQTRQRIVTTGPTFELDYRDHPFNPTKGNYSRLNIEYADPILGSNETIKYIRSVATVTHYLPLASSGWVWANSIRGGYIENLSERSDGAIPYDKKGFTLGGPSTIRGYDPTESFPNNAFEFFPGSIDATQKFQLTTSATLLMFKSELRFPISGNIMGGVFYDGGQVTIEGLKIEDPYRDSAGFALRYQTPVGAASAEVGFKLDRKTARSEELWRFHLTIGTF